jgi:hypothetical protein
MRDDRKLPATSSNAYLDPHFLSQMASYDVAREMKRRCRVFKGER